MLIYCDECIIYNFYFNEINKLLNYYKMSWDKERKIIVKIKKVYEVYILNRLEIFKLSWVIVFVYNNIDKLKLVKYFKFIFRII